MQRDEILNRAKECICKERQAEYGDAKVNFSLVGLLWEDYLSLINPNISIDAEDVAIMMALLKIARIATGSGTADSFVDLAGYAALAGEISTQHNFMEGKNE